MKSLIYKRFLRNLALSLVGLSILYVVLFSLQFGPYVPTEYWIRDVYILKHYIAGDIKEGYGGMGSPGWEVSSYSKKSLSSFVKYCRENEIRVFFTWPCTLKSERFDLNNRVIRDNLAKIKGFLNNLAVPVLGEPEDFYFERKYFFDSHYHLNWAGREIRTGRLTGHLQRQIFNNSRFPRK